jgi:hypothetical protein
VENKEKMPLVLAVMLIAAATSSLAQAGACITERVAEVPDGWSWVRANPGLNEKALWKITEGSTVKYCGKSRADKRSPPIIWHWVSFKSKEEPWDHEGTRHRHSGGLCQLRER